MFDPHSCDNQGLPASSGKACLVQTSLEDLVFYLNARINFELNYGSNQFYSLHNIAVRLNDHAENTTLDQIILDDVNDMMFPNENIKFRKRIENEFKLKNPNFSRRVPRI